MKFKFNFSLDIWITDLEIEADSLDEAKEKLYQMSDEEKLEEGNDKESDITNLDYEVIEKTYTVKVTNVTYDEDVDPTGLSTEFVFKITCAEEDLENEIEDYILFDTDESPKNYRYKILKEE